MDLSQFISYLRDALVLAGGLLVGGGLVVFLVARARRALWESPDRVGQRDLAGMMILMQTMKDMLQQQKALARQLNETIERKVRVIRETVQGANTEMDTLRTTVKVLAESLQTTRAELQRVQSVLSESRQNRPDDRVEPTPSPAVDRADAPLAAPSVAYASVTDGARAAGPDVEAAGVGGSGDATTEAAALAGPLDIPNGLSNARRELLATPGAPVETASSSPSETPHRTSDVALDTDSSDDILDAWVGLDLGFEGPEPVVPPAPHPPPTAHERPELARDAFRALLDLDEAKGRRGVSSQSSAEHDSNGGTVSAPLKSRVYAYRDAGMSVAQIAGELGVGKGEVRLILSLRKEEQ